MYILMRASFFFIGVLIAFTSCTERVICPAYQSAFMHDKHALTAHFSYFQPDSTPKIREADKTRFLLIEPVVYEKRIRELRTIEMRDIYPTPPDSIIFDQDLMLADRDVIDSTARASAKEELHPGLKGPFNTDQELYMYYLRDILLLPDARSEMNIEYESIQKNTRRNKKELKKQSAVEEEKENKGPFSIFGKKEKKETPPVDPEEEGEDNNEDDS